MIAAGDLWKLLRDKLVELLRFGDYTLDAPNNATVSIIKAPTQDSDGNWSGGVYEEARTGVVFPFENYIPKLEYEDIVTSKAQLSFQIVMRLSNKNSYEQVEYFIQQATNLANDALIYLHENYRTISGSIKDIESINHNFVGVSKADGTADSDWLVIINPKVNVVWLADYSDCVNTNPDTESDDYIDPNNPPDTRVGIFIENIETGEVIQDLDFTIES